MKKRKTLYSVIAVLVVSVSMIGTVSYFNYKQKQQTMEEKSIEKSAKIWIMRMFGYLQEANDYDKDSDPKAYEYFLQDKNLPTLLTRIKERINNDYPDIDYEDITTERLRTEYMAVSEELELLMADIDNYSTDEISFRRDIVDVESRMMRWDGIWVSEGNSKVDEDSPVALMRKAKAGCMRILYVSDYASSYTLNGYNDRIFEKFLASKALPSFLDYYEGIYGI